MISTTYNLDSSTSLAGSFTVGDGSIASSYSLEGSGNNSVAQTTSNQKASVSCSTISTGDLISKASSYASGDLATIGLGLQASGQSESTVIGRSGSLKADQEAQVADGVIASSQMATAQSGTVNAIQASNIAGSLGYANGEAQATNNNVKVTGGLNGAGGISGFIATTASDSAKASASLQANSFESKAYSAVKSTSDMGDVYSYLSSNDQLASEINAVADGHVSADQSLQAKGDAGVYAESTSEDLIPKNYNARSEELSGSVSLSAGSPAVIEIDLEGAVQSTTDALLPTPGSWIWDGLGGYINSNLYMLKDDQGRNHIFAKGGESGLWDNVDGDWQGLGGLITSDPCAVKDDQGKIHVLTRGGEGALWEKTLGGSWKNLGGYITSNPSAAIDTDDNHIKVAVKGGENALWIKDINTGVWSSMGGIITSNPQVIFDAQGKMHTQVRGKEGALWDNVDGTWRNRGGYITSDAKPVLNPFNPDVVYTFVRGGEGALWSNEVNMASDTASWTKLGGSISQNSGGLNKGNPAPVVDTDGDIHAFVRGSEGALWDNVNGKWYNLGGSITSDPAAMRDKDGRLYVAARGSDNSLLTNTLGVDNAPTSLVGPVACDYRKIQTAIDAASAGSTVKVLSGTYYENLNIFKSLSLQGIDTGTGKPIADGNKANRVLGIGPGVEVTVSNMVMQNGQAEWGGAIWNSGTMNLNNVAIHGNHADNGGGGIYNNQGTLNLNGVYMSHNAAILNGGAIFNYGTLNVNGGSIDHNSGFLGGGILNERGSVILNGAIISDNVATGSGGGIYNNYGTLVMNDGSIEGNTANTASGDGGGICNYGTFTLNKGSLINNTAFCGGGLADEKGGSTTIVGGSISYNKATGSGGGIYNWYGGGSNINGGSIDHNWAFNDGGGIAQDHSVLNLNGGFVGYNTAQRVGGGICNIVGGTLNLNGGSVSYNSANSGGGIYTESTMAMNRGSVDHNSAKWGGGVFNNGAVTLNDGSIAFNTATYGGGIYRNSGTVNGKTSLVHSNIPNQVFP